VIQPGGYLVVFASGKDRAVAGTVLHTDFSLDADGEYLAFSDPGGAILSEYNLFPTQSADVSYGVISTTPGAQQAYFTTPTPAVANNPSTAPAEAVQFSHSSRTFNQGTTLNVTLSVVSPTATIRYTTNRSVPTASSTLYKRHAHPGERQHTHPRARLRARSARWPVGSQTYFRLDAAAQTFTSNLPIVVTTSWGTALAENVTVPAHLMIFQPKIADGLARMTNLPDLSTPCSIERRGSSTAGDPKYSLSVETWDESNNDRNFPILGMPSDSDWVMHAPYQFDRSMMHNDLIYRLSNEAGRYAVRTKFVEHFHNTSTTMDGIEGRSRVTWISSGSIASWKESPAGTTASMWRISPHWTTPRPLCRAATFSKPIASMLATRASPRSPDRALAGSASWVGARTSSPGWTPSKIRPTQRLSSRPRRAITCGSISATRGPL
jgi:hypothetical protein